MDQANTLKKIAAREQSFFSVKLTFGPNTSQLAARIGTRLIRLHPSMACFQLRNLLQNDTYRWVILYGWVIIHAHTYIMCAFEVPN